MSDPMVEALVRLLELSLAEWGLVGSVRQASNGDIELRVDRYEILVHRAPHGMPFGWVLIVEARKRTAASIGGVLRIVRQTLAPGYQPLSVRIAPAPIVPLPVQGRSIS